MGNTQKKFFFLEVYHNASKTSASLFSGIINIVRLAGTKANWRGGRGGGKQGEHGVWHGLGPSPTFHHQQRQPWRPGWSSQSSGRRKRCPAVSQSNCTWRSRWWLGGRATIGRGGQGIGRARRGARSRSSWEGKSAESQHRRRHVGEHLAEGLHSEGQVQVVRKMIQFFDSNWRQGSSSCLIKRFIFEFVGL